MSALFHQLLIVEKTASKSFLTKTPHQHKIARKMEARPFIELEFILKFMEF